MKFSLKHSRKSSVYQHEFHVLRVWIVALSLFFIGLIVSAITHVFIFMGVRNGEFFGLDTIEEPSGSVVSAAIINDVAGTLKERGDTFVNITSEPVPVDPS